MLPRHRRDRYGINSILWVDATARSLLSNARKPPAFSLVVTIDTAVAGMRERDLRNGVKELLSGKLGSKLPFVSQLLTKPRWLAGFLADRGLMKFPNVVVPGKGPMLYADVTAALEHSVVTWDDLSWIREAWNGPIVIKGIHTERDARRAVDVGANALVVSNHGGRQLDSVAPTLRILPEVVASIGDRIEVLLDGGIRRGSDIVKALCLGVIALSERVKQLDARSPAPRRAHEPKRRHRLGCSGSATDPRARSQARVSLLKKIKLSDD
jgi:L-lactate dehydrogenase (cytochrome)